MTNRNLNLKKTSRRSISTSALKDRLKIRLFGLDRRRTARSDAGRIARATVKPSYGRLVQKKGIADLGSIRTISPSSLGCPASSRITNALPMAGVENADGTVTINYTDDLPLAQGVSFDVD